MAEYKAKLLKYLTQAKNVILNSGEAIETRVAATTKGNTYTFSATGQSYTCLSDGYAYIRNATNYVGELIIQDSTGSQIGILKPLTNLQNQSASALVFVRKGMKLQTGLSSFSEAAFIALQ